MMLLFPVFDVVVMERAPYISLNNLPKIAIMKYGSFIDFGISQEVVTEENLKKVYNLDVILLDLDDGRKVCVSLKSNLKLDYEFFSR